jgi:TRAP-type mannitol/chloroaromatic compound transport system permease large subunit
VIPFVILQLIGLGICIAFPEAVLWLPNMIK